MRLFAFFILPTYAVFRVKEVILTRVLRSASKSSYTVDTLFDTFFLFSSFSQLSLYLRNRKHCEQKKKIYIKRFTSRDNILIAFANFNNCPSAAVSLAIDFFKQHKEIGEIVLKFELMTTTLIARRYLFKD